MSDFTTKPSQSPLSSTLSPTTTQNLQDTADSSNVSADVNNANSAPTADGVNPLDALEQILKDAKAKSEVVAPATATAAATAPVVDEATRKAEIAKLAEKQVVEDQAAIGFQLSELKQVSETPAYIARVEQDQARKQQDDEKKRQDDANAIVQLGHTKI